MACDIVLGGQWGDEGKAKVIDFLSSDYDYITRFQGGANAGHTVKSEGKKYVFHLIPSGILYPEKTCVLGNGVVIDIAEILNEIQGLRDQGIDPEGRILISNRAFCVLPYHRMIDQARESIRKNKIGTTGRGIGPAYADKLSRIGIRIDDLKNKEKLEDLLTEYLKEKQCLFEYLFPDKKILDPKAIAEEAHELYLQIKPMVSNTPYVLNEALDAGKNVLFEGAQGTGLDIDFGSYPYVTSSNCTSGGAATGTGVGVSKFEEVIGVFKVYITRVGAGAMPTILTGHDQEKMREIGGEYGATTGRPRDCGWFDGVQARYSVMVNGMTGVALTKLDIMDTYDTIKVCTHYDIDGVQTNEFPVDITDLEKAKPVYKELPGWKSSTAGITEYAKLPENARALIEFISETIKAPVKYVSTGPDRLETIVI